MSEHVVMYQYKLIHMHGDLLHVSTNHKDYFISINVFIPFERLIL